MTENDFRINHSKIIEAYQLIEMRLKMICAGLLSDEERDWLERFDDYELEPLGNLIKKIREEQPKKHITLFSPDDFESLDLIRKTRNYWAHQCFGGHSPIVFSREGTVKRPVYAAKVIDDLRNAEDWNDKLTEIFRSLKQINSGRES